MKHNFHGRDHELKLLDRLWHSQQAELLILNGRRRVGKTALLSEWVRRVQPRILYWVAYSTSPAALLRSFSQSVQRFAHPDQAVPDGFTYPSWEKAFHAVASLAEGSKRMALLIDDFSHILNVDGDISGQLLDTWDLLFSKRNILICLSGAQLGLMKRELLPEQSALYERASMHLYLQPFSFGATSWFFPDYPAAERAALYAIYGGTPAYWQTFSPEHCLYQNITENLLAPNSLLQVEPRLLLQDFVSDAHNYNAILSAVANGMHTIKDIAAATGLPSGHITKYMSVLLETGLIERRVPVMENKSSHSGRYHITEPYLRFYFRFLLERQSQLAFGDWEQAMEDIRRSLPDFIAGYTFTEICREWLAWARTAGELPCNPRMIGGAWTADAHVDVAALDPEQRILILGDCWWTETPINSLQIAELVSGKAQKLIPRDGEWKVFFLGFSRAGWTEEAHAFQEQINRQTLTGPNYVTCGMRLVDLGQLDDDLRRQWT
jgi:uncharacterized protein